MKINILTKVKADYKTVWERFDKDLFLKLSPPFPPVKLLRFDGCLKGNKVQLELNFLIFKQRWDALIIENGQDANQYYFIDEGTKLPFFISKWHHKHTIRKSGNGTEIIDAIEFSSPFGYLIYPVLYLQFLYRRPIYRKYFT